MRKLIAAVAVVGVVFLVGCQDTKKITTMQGTIDKQTQQITELEGQVAQLTAARDSLAKLVPPPAATKGTGSKTGGTGKSGGTKPTRTGR